MKYRYAPDPDRLKKKNPNDKPGRFSEPNKWVTGPDPLRHEKYYAYLKHKSQATYRNEEYKLSWPEWEEIWSNDEDWWNRGRGSHDICLAKLDRAKPWEWDNVKLMKRIDYLKMPRFIKEVNG